MTYLDIPVESWFTYADLYSEMIDAAQDGAVFVEVGSFLGRSAAFMGSRIKESGKRISFFCVDLWDNRTKSRGDQSFQDRVLLERAIGHGDLFGTFLANIQSCCLCGQVLPVRKSSLEASALFAAGSLDFCFIDASHDYDSVVEDIEAWIPRVKRGGTIAGHDYRNGHPSVDNAVGGRLAGYALRVEQESWILKIGER